MLAFFIAIALADPPEAPVSDPFAPSYGAPFESREALFLVDHKVGGKRLQAVTLLFDSGDEWILAYRPREEHWPFVEKRVVVSGRPYTPSPNVQAVMATHVELDSIELADGETPWDPVPTSVPPPPLVDSYAALQELPTRWGLLQGTLLEIAEDEEGQYWFPFRFQDAAGVERTGEIRRDQRTVLSEQVGEPVTLYAKAIQVDGDEMISVLRACSGHVDRCETDQTRKSKKAVPTLKPKE